MSAREQNVVPAKYTVKGGKTNKGKGKVGVQKGKGKLGLVPSKEMPVTATEPPTVARKTINEVICGGLARACSQSTIHPLDTFKVRVQACSHLKKPVKPKKAVMRLTRKGGLQVAGRSMQRAISNLSSLYRGVGSAAAGAGIAIGAYFFFYSAVKTQLERRLHVKPASAAFAAGAVGAVCGGLVKVPIAVCLRSVQAGVYPNTFVAAKRITQAAGYRGLLAGYFPSLLEDVPDTAVKFAAYESLRAFHRQFTGKDRHEASTVEDLAMGSLAGAVAAAATTPFDVVKTRMMTTAASRPTFISSARAVAVREGLPAFFTGVGPRTLSSAINSGIFFVFFEAFSVALLKVQKEKNEKRYLPLRQRSNGSFLDWVIMNELRLEPVYASLSLALTRRSSQLVAWEKQIPWHG